MARRHIRNDVDSKGWDNTKPHRPSKTSIKLFKGAPVDGDGTQTDATEPAEEAPKPIEEPIAKNALRELETPELKPESQAILPAKLTSAVGPKHEQSAKQMLEPALVQPAKYIETKSDPDKPAFSVTNVAKQTEKKRGFQKKQKEPDASVPGVPPAEE